jgi:transcriptional regulator
MFYASTDLPDDGLPLLAGCVATRVATLVGVAAGEFLVSHLPLMLDEPTRVLTGHLSRANPHARARTGGEAVLVIYAGPDGYVSPSAYPSKAENPRVVPTWNYASLLVRGQLELFDDPGELLEFVTLLTERHEAGSDKPWKIDDAPEEYVRRMLRGIVGLRIRVASIESRDKLSQNRSDADQLGVIESLARPGGSIERELAETMCAHRAARIRAE